MSRVVFGSKYESRGPAGQPAQTEEIKPGDIGYAAPMHRRSAFVEDAALHPAEIECVSGRPHDARYPGGAEIELEDRLAHARRLRFGDASRWLLGQVETFPCRMGVGRVEHGAVVRITLCEIGGQVRGEVHAPIVKDASPAQQCHAA